MRLCLFQCKLKLALITEAIAQSNLELLRDRIASILVDELNNQATLQQSVDPDLAAQLSALQVFSERFYPLSDSEFPAIVIFFFIGEYDNKSQHSKRGVYQYYIDLLTKAQSTPANNADKISAIRAQRLALLINAILEDPNYLTLGFPPADGVVQRTLVRNLKRTEEEYTRDALGALMYRLIFEVVVAEQTNTIASVPLALSTTNVRIAETDRGYQYIYDPGP